MPLQSYKDHHPRVGKDVYVSAHALVIGDVVLADNVSVWPMTVVRGDVNSVCIGRDSNIQDGSVLHVSRPQEGLPDGAPLIIGEEVTVGHKVVLHGCTIGNRCLIGMGAIVMDKAQIGDEVLLAAGSLVPPGRSLDSGYLYQGRPARRVRSLTPDEIGGFTISAQHYVALKRDYVT